MRAVCLYGIDRQKKTFYLFIYFLDDHILDFVTQNNEEGAQWARRVGAPYYIFWVFLS